MPRFPQKLQINSSKSLSGKYLPLLAVVVVFGGLGTALLLTSHAATPTANLEAEDGTVSSAASNVADSTASGVHTVKFGSGSSGGNATCPAYPAFPDASCTGWQHTGVTLRTVKAGDSGPGWHVDVVGGGPVFYADTAGAVIDGLDIPFQLKIFANNVTIQRSRVRNGGYYSVFIGDPPTTYSGLRMIDDEIDGMNDPVNPTIAINESDNATFIRANIHGMGSSGPRLGSGTDIEDSWIHDFHQNPGEHLAGLSSNDNATGIILRHNNISIDAVGASSTIALYRDFGKPDNVLVEKNLLNGGNYCIMAGIQASDGSYPPVNNIRFLNNVLGREFSPECGRLAPYAQFSSTNGTGNVWSGNTWGGGAAATSAHTTGDPIP